MKYVETKYLKIALFDEGPKDGPVVFLIHGWPDDATTWRGVVPHLHQAGFRTVAPMLRGFGQTRFLSAATRLTGNAGILAWDAIDLADAMEIKTFAVAGHDWGSTVAEYLAIGWPSRVNKIAMIATTSRMGGLKTWVRARGPVVVSVVSSHPCRRTGHPERPKRICPDDVGAVVAQRLVRRGNL